MPSSYPASSITNPAALVYSRAEGLSKGDGMVGTWNALRKAVFGPHADRVLLVRYESLTTNPLAVLTAIYRAIGETMVAHDAEHIAPARDMIEFDSRLDTPGLHEVRPVVRAEKRSTVLPPDLFTRYEQDAFWDDPARLPSAVRVV